MKSAAEKFAVTLAGGLAVALFVALLPVLNSSMAIQLGAGFSTFFNGVWFAIKLLFFVGVGLGIAFITIKFKQMHSTHVIVDKDGRPVRAIVHKGELVQIASDGMDISEIMKLQAQQAAQMKQFSQMFSIATKSMSQFMDEYVIDADDDDEEDEGDDQIETTQPKQIAPPRPMSMTGSYEEQLATILAEFQVHAQVLPEVTKVGPRVIQLGVIPTGVPGRRTRIAEITQRERDIQLALRATSIRIIAPVPGTHYVGIEIPNPEPTMVTIGDVLESSEYQDAAASSKLVFALGRDITGDVRVCDIEQAPHLLIGGATNQGKSVLLNVLIVCLLSQATPEDVRLLMVDPKQVELTPYNGVPHLLRPVITDMTQVVPMLKRAIDEAERRYGVFAELGVHNLSEYREARKSQPDLENLPSWVIIFDEFADLMMTAPSETEENIIRIAQKGRAAGVHLVITTQKPVVKVVTGLIKGNLPTSIALKTKTEGDSRVILDEGGAERLLGKGDMLYRPPDTEDLIRIQGAYITGSEIQSIAAFWKGESVSTAVSSDELNGNAQTAGNADGNGLETASEATGKIIDGVFTGASPITEELTETAPVSRAIRETIKRLAAMPNMSHRKVASAVGLSGRKYSIYQQVCKEEGIVIKQQAEEA